MNRATLLGYATLLASALITQSALAEMPAWGGRWLNALWLAEPSNLLDGSLLPTRGQPAFVAWMDDKPSSSLDRVTGKLESASAARLAELMARRPALEYSPRDSFFTLSLEPGSPCTGACLKLAGSF